MRLPLAAALSLLLAAPAAHAAFDDAEREAIREEVRAFLLENPEILRDMIGLLEAQEAGAVAAADEALVTEHAEALFDDGYSHVGGNPEGDVTVVEFFDYQCGFCRRAHPEVEALLERDGNIRLVAKEYPILGPGSELASRAAIATLITAGPEAYGRLSSALMTLTGQVTDVSLDAVLEDLDLDAEAIRAEMDSEEVSRRIAETRALAGAMGIQGTPTFIIEDRIVRGYVPLADMQAMVAEARASE